MALGNCNGSKTANKVALLTKAPSKLARRTPAVAATPPSKRSASPQALRPLTWYGRSPPRQGSGRSQSPRVRELLRWRSRRAAPLQTTHRIRDPDARAHSKCCARAQPRSRKTAAWPEHSTTKEHRQPAHTRAGVVPSEGWLEAASPPAQPVIPWREHSRAPFADDQHGLVRLDRLVDQPVNAGTLQSCFDHALARPSLRPSP